MEPRSVPFPVLSVDVGLTRLVLYLSSIDQACKRLTNYNSAYLHHSPSCLPPSTLPSLIPRWYTVSSSSLPFSSSHCGVFPQLCLTSWETSPHTPAWAGSVLRVDWSTGTLGLDFVVSQRDSVQPQQPPVSTSHEAAKKSPLNPHLTLLGDQETFKGCGLVLPDQTDLHRAFPPSKSEL